MTNILMELKKLIPEKIRMYVKNSYFYRKISFRLYNGIVVKNKLRQNLSVPDLLIETKEYFGQKILVPLIETSHYQIYQVLLIAKALQLRGADVLILVCDETLPGCEIKSSRNTKVNPCLNCKMNAHYLIPEFKLNIKQLSNIVPDKKIEKFREIARNIVSEYPPYYEYAGVDIIRTVDDSVIRYFYGGVPGEGSEELNDVRLRYVTSILIGFEAAKSIHKTWNPDIIFGNMEVYVDWSPYHKYFSKHGKKSSTISMSQFNYKTLLVNANDLYRSNKRYLNWTEISGRSSLTASQEDEIQQFISKRFKGNSDVFRQYGYFDEDSESITVDKSKRNIFLFSNVFWDVGMSEFGELYSGVISWVLSSVDLIKDYPDCHLYIKPHPSESFDVESSKGVVDFINEKFPQLPSNITIIFPEMKIRTYDLFEHIDVGVVYNGTLGLEMLFSGIPVISCGKTPYGGINLVSEPDTEKAYLELLLGERNLEKPSKEQVSHFAYFYFIKTLIPWKYANNAYGEAFKGFKMDNIRDLIPSSDYYLDHLCKSIMSPDEYFLDSWKDPN